MDLIFEKRFYRWLSLHPALIKFDARRTMGHDEKQNKKIKSCKIMPQLENFDLTALCEAFLQKNLWLGDVSKKERE